MPSSPGFWAALAEVMTAWCVEGSPELLGLSPMDNIVF